jgi:transposase
MIVVIMFVPRMAWSLEQLRNLAVSMVIDDAETPQEVAAALDVSERSVWRWLAAWRDAGAAGLAAKPGRGRPAKLTDAQSQRVLGWVAHGSPCDFGFVTERWTAPRVARLIERRFGVHMNHRYLNDWLLRRGRITPQVPERQPRERDQRVIDAWLDEQWPRIKKR